MATPRSSHYPSSPNSHRPHPSNTIFAPLDFLDLGPDTSPGHYLAARSPAFDSSLVSTPSYPSIQPYPAGGGGGGQAGSYAGSVTSPASTHSRRGSIDSKRSASRGGGPRGGSKSKSRVSGGAGAGQNGEMSMDVDATQSSSNGAHGQQEYGQEFRQDHSGGLAPLQTQFEMRDLEAMYAANGNGSAGGFDIAGALQQLEGIHMQSPVIFTGGSSTGSGGLNPENPSFQHMAAMYLSSPHMPSPNSTGMEENGDGKWRNAGVGGGVGGIITPGPSGEMIPQNRLENMSPMQLEFLAKVHAMEGMDMNNAPLLSPALTHQASSAYASPANAAAFPGSFPSPLETLQEQQRQFQEQLILLQYQQRQIQATAAAVAATTSPFLPTSGPSSQPSSGQTRPVTTPGTTGPSPSYFSPLTSPALEATRHHFHHYSPAFNGGPGASRPPHPLSALSSPALNPVGVSGGAQQTLSPAIQPQDNADIADPDYIRALVGMFDNDTASPLQPLHHQQGNLGSSQYQSSMVTGAGTGSAAASPLSGPNRSSLPHKTRPSPMMKPTHRRGPSSNATFSLPSSPAAFTKLSQIPPPANGGVQMTQIHPPPQHIPGSNASTPSPVDLSQIMPPPPVPGGSRAMTPMTPASLMNLAGGSRSAPGSLGPMIALNMDIAPSAPPQMSIGEAAPRRQASLKASTSSSTSANGASGQNGRGRKAPAAPVASSKKPGNRNVPAGKQRIAARATAVGVRTATKASALAASLAPLEGENRKTSHKAAEQKRRDSLKAGFDELRLLLPPINTEALDPETGEPVPGSSAPRLLPKSSLVPDDNPNRGVSKVALLRFSNEYIGKLHERVDKRDDYIARLRDEVSRLRSGEESMVMGDDGEDLLEMDMAEGEDEYEDGEEEEEGEGDEGLDEVGDDEDEDIDEDDTMDEKAVSRIKRGTTSRPAIARNGSVRGR